VRIIRYIQSITNNLINLRGFAALCWLTQSSAGTLASPSLQSRLQVYKAFTEAGATLLGILITPERGACWGSVTYRQCVTEIGSYQNTPQAQTAPQLLTVSLHLTTGHIPYCYLLKATAQLSLCWSIRLWRRTYKPNTTESTTSMFLLTEDT
jgi:hypothetical protein